MARFRVQQITDVGGLHFAVVDDDVRLRDGSPFPVRWFSQRGQAEAHAADLDATRGSGEAEVRAKVHPLPAN